MPRDQLLECSKIAPRTHCCQHNILRYGDGDNDTLIGFIYDLARHELERGDHNAGVHLFCDDT